MVFEMISQLPQVLHRMELHFCSLGPRKRHIVDQVCTSVQADVRQFCDFLRSAMVCPPSNSPLDPEFCKFFANFVKLFPQSITSRFPLPQVVQVSVHLFHRTTGPGCLTSPIDRRHKATFTVATVLHSVMHHT